MVAASLEFPIHRQEADSKRFYPTKSINKMFGMQYSTWLDGINTILASFSSLLLFSTA